MNRKTNPIKEKRAEEARQHTEYMSKKYKVEIENSVKLTKLYNKNAIINDNRYKEGNVKIQIVDEDSVTALFNHYDKKTCVLNFASYRHPGGNFINGSRAQEESLCLESFLYNVLVEFQSFYAWNNKHINNSLYLNRALYSPKVVFEHNNMSHKFDVLTCASPNLSAARKKITEDENTKELENRIKFIVDILLANNVETAILGAFGCGVFGQNPIEVATIFEKIISKYCLNKKMKIVFAIPQGNNDNLISFQKVFKDFQ